MDRVKKFFQKLKTIKNIEIIIGLVIIAVMVLIYSSVSGVKAKSSDVETATTTESITGSLEARLEQILSEIDGAGEVKVMITYATTAELVAAGTKNEHSTTTTSGSYGETVTTTSTYSPVVVSGGSGSELIILQEKMPEIMGVIVVAEGANDMSIKLKLLSATSTVLGVNANSIQIYSRRDV